MHKSIGVYEAKTQLPALLRQTKNGDSFTITVRGKEVAELVPISQKRDVKQTLVQMDALQKKVSARGALGGLEFIKKAKAEGRR